MRRVADALLWVGAVLGALSLVAAVLVATLGLVPLIFTSGSMSPEIPAGSLGVARSVPAADLATGDVVSVESAEGVRVTHRVVAVEESADGALLTLQGDANNAPDADPYPVTEADRLLFSVPGLGSVLSALTNPFAVFGAGVLAAGVLFGIASSYRSSRGRGPADSPERPARSSRAGRTVVSLLVAALPAVLVLQPSEPTVAAFSDAGVVSTSAFVSHRVGQPTGGTCGSGTSSSLTVTTPASDSRYTYWVQAFTAATGGTAVSAPKQMAGTGPNRSTTLTAPADFTSTLTPGTDYYLRVFARVAGTTWQSEEYRYSPFSRSATNVLSCGPAPSPPVITFAQPADGSTTTRAQTNSNVSATCGANRAACGTATDNGSIPTPPQYILRRTNILTGTQCWTGSSWTTDCSTYRTAGYDSVTDQWWVPGGNAYPVALVSRNYTLTVRATDNLGYTVVSTITYTVTP